MTNRRLLHLIIAAFVAVLAFTSCDEQQQVKGESQAADSLLNVAYESRDYQRLLALVDEMDSLGTVSKMKSSYWKGYAYSRLRQFRLAEVAWKEAVSLPVQTGEDLTYYAKSANRLAGLLYVKIDYEGTMQVAIPAIELLNKKGFSPNSDYVNLQAFIGNCQLKMGHPEEAAVSYDEAYQHFQKITEASNELSDYTSSVICAITITDTYLTSGYYREAYDWTERLDNVLSQYKSHPHALASFVDKQYARLNFYRACSLEGLGKKKEAEHAYNEALTTDYAKTDDGKMEATNYLLVAKRWNEAADKLAVLDRQMEHYDVKFTLDNIQTYMLPKFRANVEANRTDTVMALALKLCDALDSAILLEKQDASLELATIYNIKQKETQIMEQREALSRQRFIATVIAFFIVVVGFSLIIYFRHQSSLRLERAFSQLEVANAKAEESSRMKTNFIKQISHEIRTPLNILSGFTQVITTPGMKLDEETSKDINQKIIENTNRITGLVNKMLELSDVNSRAVIERNDTVLALQIAAQAAEDSGISVANHLHFDISYSAEAETLMLTTNLQQATRALSLLLDNAKKFTEKGGALLHVDSRDGQVAFSVSDTGIGVPEGEAEHIFEEFVQLDDYYEGTGIGLTVARSIANRLGGNIVLDKDYTSAAEPSFAEMEKGGGGARFVMMLPLSDVSGG
ncbi:MAG: HAMP domain-containing histidine kinase [Prevotella sp.]|nr:HAMP domain-containing histidine kinase [Prevotella sp.]